MDLKENAKVGIVAGSKSDQETVDKITAVLDSFGIVWEFNILSAHRTPNATAKYAREAAGRGLQVLIGVAGLAAALPGVLAGHTIFGRSDRNRKRIFKILVIFARKKRIYERKLIVSEQMIRMYHCILIGNAL